VVRRVVHGVDQRQIAQLETTVNEALRKYVAAHHHFSINAGTLILASPELHAQVASYEIMSWFERRKYPAQSKVPLSVLIS
jgi:hypothetical protein